jgi:hypothetical protein
MRATVALLCMSWLSASARASDRGVVVRGDTECPTSGEVSTALVGLIARRAPVGAPDVLRLLGGTSGAATGLTLVLTNAAGELVARRELAAEARSCAELARTAAVVVAAWEARLATSGYPSLPVSSAPPSSSPPDGTLGGRGGAGAGRAGEAQAPSAVALLPRGGADPAATAPAPISGPPPEAPPAPPSVSVAGPGNGLAAGEVRHRGGDLAIDVETGAAFLVSVASASSSVAPGALAEVTLSRRDFPSPGLGFGVLAIGTHATDLMAGGVLARGAWRRVGGVIDLRSRSMRSRAVQVDLRLGLALTALAIQGQSLPVTSGATLFDPGMLVGFRVRTRFGQVVPFLELAAAIWPRGHTMYVGGTAISADVPSLEGWLSAGICLIADR